MHARQAEMEVAEAAAAGVELLLAHGVGVAPGGKGAAFLRGVKDRRFAGVFAAVPAGAAPVEPADVDVERGLFAAAAAAAAA